MLRRTLSATSLAALAVGLGACREDPACFAGDPSADPEMVVVHLESYGVARPTAPGDLVPLLQPPQGGRVMFIGARARNLGCAVHISMTLRDVCTSRLVSRDDRDTVWRPAPDGWLEPDPIDISTFANLGACPRPGIDRDMDGEPWDLDFELSDGKRSVRTALRLVPTCSELELPEACRCECDAEYELGSATCPVDPDAGVPPGTCPEPDGGA